MKMEKKTMTTDNKSTTGAGEAPDCLNAALGNFWNYLHAEDNKRNEILNLLRDLQGGMRDLHERLEAVERTVNATLAYVTKKKSTATSIRTTKRKRARKARMI